MDGWNVTQAGPLSYVVMNEDDTVVRLSKRVPSSVVAELLSKMEELGVPLAYTQYLREIYVTMLPVTLHGDYGSNKIRLSYGPSLRGSIDRTLVHELGHHVDNIEGISDELSIAKAQRKRVSLIDGESVGEDVANGFEIYYLGTAEEKKTMRLFNKKLHEAISDVHRKYKKL